jgi:hypothetical protein
MLLTVFTNDMLNLTCFEEDDLEKLITSLTQEEPKMDINSLLIDLSEMVGIAIMYDQQDAWDELFNQMEPRGPDMEPTDKKTLDQDSRERIKTGARNLVAEMKRLYPKQYDLANKRAQEVLNLTNPKTPIEEMLDDPDLDKLPIIIDESIDPELAALLEDEPGETE